MEHGSATTSQLKFSHCSGYGVGRGVTSEMERASASALLRSEKAGHWGGAQQLCYNSPFRGNGGGAFLLQHPLSLLYIRPSYSSPLLGRSISATTPFS